MSKIALLIGVSEYESGLSPLPGALKDIEAFQRVLRDQEMGAFDQVEMLHNPEPIAMQEAIQSLFGDRTKEDLILLFFSGHGIRDDSGKLYFTTRLTRKSPKGDLIKATAVPANFVQDIMSDSRSRRQVVILDCCFSGAFAPENFATQEGFVPKGDGSTVVDVEAQLRGNKEIAEGRVILTSSTSTQYSFEQQGSELSTYTRYLIEGIETGAADKGDGEISVGELHDYAKSKVQESAPAMKPEIYAAKEGYKIVLSKAPTSDPKLVYQRAVEKICKKQKRKDELSLISRSELEEIRTQQGLSAEDAAAIEARVLKPYQDYKRKLKQYEQTLSGAAQGNKTLDEETIDGLKDYQKTLGLRDEDVEPIEIKVFGKIVKPKSPSQSLFYVVRRLVTKIIGSVTDSKPLVTSSTAGFGRSLLRNPKLLLSSGVTALIVIGFLAAYSVQRFRFDHFYSLGQEKLKKEEFREAIDAFKQALEIDEKSAKAYVGLGNALFKNGDADEASSKFSEAIQHNSKFAEAYFSRGLLEQEQGKREDAIEDFKKTIELDRKHSRAYLNLGKIYQGEAKNKDALDQYDQVIKLDPKSAEAYYYQCKAFLDLQKYSDAIKDCSAAIDVGEQQYRANAYFQRALAYIYRQQPGDLDFALEDNKKVLDTDPNNPWAYNNLGRILEAKGEYIAAISAFGRAIGLIDFNSLDASGKTELAKIYTNRATTRLQMANPDIELIDGDFFQAIRTDPDYAPALEAFGDYLKDKGRIAVYKGTGYKAEFFYSKAKELYLNQNNETAAQRVWNKMSSSS